MHLTIYNTPKKIFQEVMFKFTAKVLHKKMVFSKVRYKIELVRIQKIKKLMLSYRTIKVHKFNMLVLKVLNKLKLLFKKDK